MCAEELLHYENAPALKALSVSSWPKNQLLKWNTPYFHDLALNDFLAVYKNKVCLKGRRFQDNERNQKNDDAGSYSTTGIPKLFPTVAALLG
jgi:hypothetical protein